MRVYNQKFSISEVEKATTDRPPSPVEAEPKSDSEKKKD